MPRRSKEIDKLKKAIGAELWEIRKKRSMSRQQVATVMNITQQQIWKYEKATDTISVARFFVLCNIYRISPSEIYDKVVTNDK